MTDNPARGGLATPVPKNSGRFIVDIRLFVVSITVAMCGAFFAGVTMGPSGASSPLTNVLVQQEMSSPHPSPLHLSEGVISESLKHSPSGQHLLVDIANVDAAFLNSEERLTEAMVQTVRETGLTMLSYHCHQLSPAGISCVGVLMESHISFHTWPDEGVITLDLFTCGPIALLPNAIHTMQRLFGVPRYEEESVRVKWSHELRGFRPEEHKSNNAIDAYSDLSSSILSPLDLHSKTQVYSNLTQYQRVDIWDVVELDDGPTHEDGLRLGLGEDDPRWENPDYATPERCTFLNGYSQRCSSKDKEVHEALVHPAMFAHPKPKNVAIVGGREGGALREVLKHKTVESVTLLEPDEELVKISQQYYPKMSDCSNLVGRADNCFDDELATILYEDARGYFKARYGSSSAASNELMDVILVDDKDPRHAPEMYTDKDFVSSMVKALSPEGVLMFHAGMAPDIDDPRADMGVFSVREQLINQLETHPDIEALLVYEEPRTDFDEPSVMLVACKSATCRSRWYARSEQVDYEIYERIVRTHSKERALSYYDGTTQYSYQVPPKAWETVYCRREPTPFECAYLHLDTKKELYDLDLDNETISSFRVESTTEMVTRENGNEEEVTESHVFAKVDIPQGSYVMPHHLASSLVVTDRNLKGLYKNLNVGGRPVAVIEDLLEFFEEYGHESHLDGTKNRYIEIGGSVLIRQVEDPNEANVGRWVPPHPSGKNPVFSPVYERHRMSFDVFLVTTKDIRAGAEVLRHTGLWDN